MTNDPIYQYLIDQLPSLDAKRLFHGRGRLHDGWEQINIEIYPPVLWVMVYQSIDEQQLTKVLSELVQNAEQLKLEAIYIQRRFEKGNPVELFYGDDRFLESDFWVTENNLKFLVTLGKNQNSGMFLDMCNGRQWVRENSQGKRVLNLFSYTCSLGVAALAGDAHFVSNVDMAKSAIKRGQINTAENFKEGKSASFIVQDIFKVTKKLASKNSFDLLIADPPSFQSKSFDVRKDYSRLLHKLKPAISVQADLLLCLNSPALGPDFLIDMVEEIWPDARLIERVKNPAVLADKDENASLKVMHFKLP